MGSMYTALASFLQARAMGGKWFLRIDDLDHGRELAGATEDIVSDLKRFGLRWDGPIQYQSNRLHVYQDALRYLDKEGFLYPCTCSRKSLAALARETTNAAYPGFCRIAGHSRSKAHALRVITDKAFIEFNDQQQGLIRQDVGREIGDFIVQRRDKVCAYQLAVVLDDHDLGITEAVRGIDLLNSTPRQIYLQRLLNLPTPAYSHIPILVDNHGNKLSKQSHAKPIGDEEPSRLLCRILTLLNQDLPQELAHCSPEQVIEWAIANWDPTKLSSHKQISSNKN